MDRHAVVTDVDYIHTPVQLRLGVWAQIYLPRGITSEEVLRLMRWLADQYVDTLDHEP